MPIGGHFLMQHDRGRRTWRHNGLFGKKFRDQLFGLDQGGMAGPADSRTRKAVGHVFRTPRIIPPPSPRLGRRAFLPIFQTVRRNRHLPR